MVLPCKFSNFEHLDNRCNITMEDSATNIQSTEKMSFEAFQKAVVEDYRMAVLSREASLIGRKEVLTGKAKFGIFGDGKEVPQLAMAKAFQPGDFRSGYYRDQTFIFAAGMSNVEEFFAQLYADTDLAHDPQSAGRQMNAHFATRHLDENGQWKNLTQQKNTAADTSPTASQMARAVGLAQASSVYRQLGPVTNSELFTDNGNEVTFVTIGDASTSEGIFWESVNAAGVLKIPMVISVWDDGYGISVPREYQTTKGSISTLLEGFRVNDKGEGFDIYTLYAWDYPSLVEAYTKGVQKVRETHIPAIFHIKEVTQPQGHSTSGSHERYKSKERLEWEAEYDCIHKMRQWMEENNIATADQLDAVEKEAKQEAKEARKNAWKAYIDPIKAEVKEALAGLQKLAQAAANGAAVQSIHDGLANALDPIRRDYHSAVRRALVVTAGEDLPERNDLLIWLSDRQREAHDKYRSHLYSESAYSVANVKAVKAAFSDQSETLNGYEILNKFFDLTFQRYDNVVAFGEDLGKIGDVNQGFAGLQEKHGIARIFDTGIREATIIGQGLGMAMRGLRPIAEIQYLDYLIYGLQPIVDDLATLQYRTKGGQKAPMIIRTRGHRLEGIWHTGSPIGMILHSVRGVNLCVPRNMTQAAGMYNALLQSDEPGIVIECLNGYRLKEQCPDNLADYTVALGHPEVVQEGSDITLVTYGSTLRVVQEAMTTLEELGIEAELIDVQTLIPFDVDHTIVQSLQKTNRIAFIDEDVPGGTTAFLMQQVLQVQRGYYHLDSEPITITAQDHRSAYASDGDYFCKPNAEDIVEAVYQLMHEADPHTYPAMM